MRRYLAAGTELVIGFTGIPDGLHHVFWGLHEYSYNLGFLRENFGTESNDYGDSYNFV